MSWAVYVDAIVTFTTPLVHVFLSGVNVIVPVFNCSPPGTVPVVPPVIDVAFVLTFPALSTAFAVIV